MTTPKNGPGFFNLLTSFKPSTVLGKKEPEEASWPLTDAKHDWAEAQELFQTRHYDRATTIFRRAVENLLKANCHGAWSTRATSSDLLVLAKKALGEPPAGITEALIFLNPHCTLVKSVYNYDFACEAREKSLQVIRWINGQCPSYSTFNPDIAPARKFIKPSIPKIW